MTVKLHLFGFPLAAAEIEKVGSNEVWRSAGTAIAWYPWVLQPAAGAVLVLVIIARYPLLVASKCLASAS